MTNCTIWKIALKDMGRQEIPVPVGAELLCAREQFEDICIWFRCDSSKPLEKRAIAVVGTGHPAEDDWHYLGTASLRGGNLIFHVFERINHS